MSIAVNTEKVEVDYDNDDVDPDLTLLQKIKVKVGFYLNYRLKRKIRNWELTVKDKINKYDGAIHKDFYTPNPHKEDLTSEQLFGISLGLIMSEWHGAYVDSLSMGKTLVPLENFLWKYWEIVDRESATNTITDLLLSGHRSRYNGILRLNALEESGYIPKIIFEFALGAGFPYQQSMTESLQEYTNFCVAAGSEQGKIWFDGVGHDTAVDLGTDAWDFGRGVYLCRASYTLGYITEKEAWSLIRAFSALAKLTFTNWQDYSTSYMLGRSMWSGYDNMWDAVAGFAASAEREDESPWVKYGWPKN